VTAARAAAALYGGMALLERAVSYTLGQLRLVTPGALARPTPCQRWDLRALLRHMDDSLATMQEAVDLRSVDPDPFDAVLADAVLADAVLADAVLADAEELVAGLRARGCRLLGALTGEAGSLVWIGGLPAPVRIVTSAGAIDVAVHGWDVGRACGSGRPLPEQLAEDMLSIAPLLVSGADRPERFGPPVPVPADASAGDRLVAFLGRDPRWHGWHHPADAA
jgi:uncharacterized protein (TIGR03086 family)